MFAECLEHSAILLTFIKLPFVIKIFVLSIFERPLNRFYCNAIVPKSRDCWPISVFPDIYGAIKGECILISVYQAWLQFNMRSQS